MAIVTNMIGEGLKPEGVNLNVLNILRSLIEDKESIVYIPQDYKRGSSSGYYDSKVHMMPSESGKPIKVIDISSNQERFNFSVLGLVDVIVEVENEDGSVDLVPKKVYRQYNIVRDGKLTMDYVVANLSEDSFYNLREAGILYYNGAEVPTNHKYVPGFVYKVKLEGLPIVSCNWARPIALGLYDYMTTDADATEQLKVVRSVLKAYKDEGQILPPGDSSIYIESNEKREGISDKNETYDANCVVYEIPDYVSDTFDEETIRGIYPDIRTLESYRKKLSDIQKTCRFNSRCIIMAIENSKNKGNKTFEWSELAKVPRSKNKMRQECMVDIYNKSVRFTRTEYTKTINI